MGESSVPIIIANTSPFRLIQRDENDSWNATLDDINNYSYDYVKLHRLSNFFDVGLPKPFSMAIGFDGSFILPALSDFREKEKAIGLFNKTIGEIVFGGIYYEAIQPRDLSFGELYFIGYFKQNHLNGGINANFHNSIGMKKASPLDSIKLLDPNVISFTKLMDAMTEGRRILKPFPNLSVPLTLNGITYFINNQWAESLSNIWTSIEQVVSQFWEEEIIKKDESIKNIIGRKKFLEDYRTWVSSAKIELLFQKSIIDEGTYKNLNVARKARNEFIHNGALPIKNQANSAIEALFSLISLANSNFSDNTLLTETLNNIKSFDSFEKQATKKVLTNDKVVCWIPIPPIPGDANWGDKPFEIIEDIQLKPI
jgi:hypothetical protein